MDEVTHQKIRAAMRVSYGRDGKMWLMPTAESLRLYREATMTPEEIAQAEEAKKERPAKQAAILQKAREAKQAKHAKNEATRDHKSEPQLALTF